MPLAQNARLMNTNDQTVQAAGGHPQAEERRLPRARRSQGERSAETRAALLDAAIESLIEVGYAAMSTTDVVKRAGLSRGAQVHHFPRKIDLVEAAIQRLQLKTREDLARVVADLPPDADRGETVLSLLWAAFLSPLFIATLELMVAARMDDTLKHGLRALQFEVNDTIQALLRELYGPGAERCLPLQQAVELSLVFMQGLGTASILNDEAWQREQMQRWKVLVRPLLDRAERELT